MADLDALKALHTSEIDAVSGYLKALEVAEGADAKAVLEEALQLHRRGHDRIHKLIVELGEQPDESGSFMASVHKAIITVRATFSGLDHSSLSGFADGEERIAEAYAETIRQNASDDRIVSQLTEQELAIRSLIARMKAQIDLASDNGGSP